MDFLLSEKNRPQLLAMIGALVFANSFWGRFVFDEYTSITLNEPIKHLLPPAYLYTYPNSTRPVIELSLAINYAIHGTHFWSYHVFNLVIHLIAALALYGIARRTFLSMRLRDRFGADASRLAFFIALIWMVHPLQTQSVTYIIQRCESMMGMFFLLTLYCVIRADEAVDAVRWKGLAFLFCALGMGCKQVMVTAPLIVLLYDRAFLSGSFVAAIRKRALLYLALCATCVILLPSFTKNPSGATAGFDCTGVTWQSYALTQFGVIPHYLKLAFWPVTLCIDYVWPFVDSWRAVLPGMAFIVVLVAITAIGVIRNSAWSFLGAWFFIILAPSSSIMPIKDPIFEHRMYLSLAAPVAMFVLLCDGLIRMIASANAASASHPLSPHSSARFCTWAGAFFGVIALALSVRTIARNVDYSSESRIWRKVIELYPNSQRAMQNLGNGLANEKQHAESLYWFQKALALDANNAEHNFNVAVELAALERKEEALPYYTRTLELKSDYPRVHIFIGDILRELHRHEESIAHYEAQLAADPKSGEALYGLGVAFTAFGNSQEALKYYEQVLALAPEYPEAHARIAEIMRDLNRYDEAIRHFEAELRRDPQNADLVKKLSDARAKLATTTTVN